MDALGINLSGLLTQLISFVILFLILRKLLFGPISSMLQARANKIQESLDTAERIKNEADESAERIEKEITIARQEGQKLISDARDSTDKYRTQEMEKAKEESKDIVIKANKAIEKERDLAIQSVRKEFSSLVVSAASKVVEKSIEEKDHKDLIDNALKEEVKK